VTRKKETHLGGGAENEVIQSCKELVEEQLSSMSIVVWSLAKVVIVQCFVITRQLPPLHMSCLYSKDKVSEADAHR
jgi:hypothetical protein